MMVSFMEPRVKDALGRADGNKLTFIELKKEVKMRRGLAAILEKMKQAGFVDYELDADGMMANETVISLIVPEWLNTEGWEELLESMFEAHGLPEVKSEDLEPGTYTNRQIALRFNDSAELARLLMSLPGNDPVSKRAELSSYIRKLKEAT